MVADRVLSKIVKEDIWAKFNPGSSQTVSRANTIKLSFKFNKGIQL